MNAPWVVQRTWHIRINVMDKVFRVLHFQIMLTIDILLAFRSTFEEVFSRLETVQLFLLCNLNLKLKPMKCQRFRQNVHYRSHGVTCEGTSPDPEKVREVLEWPRTVTLRYFWKQPEITAKLVAIEMQWMENYLSSYIMSSIACESKRISGCRFSPPGKRQPEIRLRSQARSSTTLGVKAMMQVLSAWSCPMVNNPNVILTLAEMTSDCLHMQGKETECVLMRQQQERYY